MSEFCAHRAKTYAFKLDNNDEVKNAKGTKKICDTKPAHLFKIMLMCFLIKYL